MTLRVPRWFALPADRQVVLFSGVTVAVKGGTWAAENEEGEGGRWRRMKNMIDKRLLRSSVLGTQNSQNSVRVSFPLLS